jgi:hypothetical protein
MSHISKEALVGRPSLVYFIWDKELQVKLNRKLNIFQLGRNLCYGCRS